MTSAPTGDDVCKTAIEKAAMAVRKRRIANRPSLARIVRFDAVA